MYLRVFYLQKIYTDLIEVTGIWGLVSEERV